MERKQKRYMQILLLTISYLLLAIGCLSFALAQEVVTNTSESEAAMEQEIIQEVEEGKQAQLKEYFREYYYKQGKDYFKKGRYLEAANKFKRALHWDPEYEPAMKCMGLIEDKMAKSGRPDEEKNLVGKIKEEAQEEKEEIVKAKKESKERISETKEMEKLAVQEEEAAPTEELATTVTYRIDKEDTLDISVWRHPELSREVIIRPDGMISFPLIGDIQAAGLTVPELDEKITQGLSEFAQKRLRPSVSDKSEEKAGYLIGLGDTLDISVWKEPDLSRQVIVRPDGMISFPLVGDIQTVGKTLTQLDEELTKSLSSYVKEPQVSVMVMSFGWKKEIPQEVLLEDNPEVSVMIKKFGGKKVIVLGDVVKPGVYTFSGDIQLIEALALAGDCTKFAVKNNVLIIRGDIHKGPTVISANILAFLKNAKLSENVLIQPQDIIFVPRSLIGNINAFVETITPIVDMVYKGTTAKTALDNF